MIEQICKKAKRAHMIVAPLGKKDNSNSKKFKPDRRNNQGTPIQFLKCPIKGFKSRVHVISRWTVRTNKKVYLWLIYVLNLFIHSTFSWYSVKLFVDWYWDIYICYEFVTRVRKKPKANQDGVRLFVANGEKVKVECIGTVKTKLEYAFLFRVV